MGLPFLILKTNFMSSIRLAGAGCQAKVKMRMIFIVVTDPDRLSTGEMTSRPLPALLPVLAFACLLGCKGGGGGGAGGNTGTAGTTGTGGSVTEDGAVAFSRADLLAAFGTCAAAGAHDFREPALALEAAVVAWQAAADDATRAAARDAFRVAMDRWQVMEMMQFGPTAPGTALGGQDFRDNIYSWPRVSRCLVEEEIVARTYESPQFSTVLLTNRRGLGALEYLLFYEGSDTACGSTSPAVAGWMALSTTERDARKRAYAVAAAHDVAVRAAGLDTAWDPAAGNFAQTMRTAGTGNSVYPSTQDALNAVSNAVFYIETEVKDMKLAKPLGLDMMACTNEICPELRESLFAERSKANLIPNVEGLRRLIEGCGPDYSGLGFDDLLVAVGAGAQAELLRTRAAAIRPTIDAIEEADLDQALMQDKPSVRAVYDAVKGVTDILKVDFVTILDLELPEGVGGDVD
jgi:uncharacterized protein